MISGANGFDAVSGRRFERTFCRRFQEPGKRSNRRGWSEGRFPEGRFLGKIASGTAFVAADGQGCRFSRRMFRSERRFYQTDFGIQTAGNSRFLKGFNPVKLSMYSLNWVMPLPVWIDSKNSPRL